ncbi:MAG: PEGA domain-containing protein, partial [Myxococcota bacterium]
PVPTPLAPKPAPAPGSAPAPAPAPAPGPAPAPAPAGAFVVTFTSIPLGAKVELVGGEEIGTTPVRRGFDSGTFRVRMTDDGGRTGESTIRVGRSMPTRYTWKASEDRWESGY